MTNVVASPPFRQVQIDTRNNPTTPLKSPRGELATRSSRIMTAIEPTYPKGTYHFDVEEGCDVYPDGFHFSWDDELLSVD
jgi:hypothetical protein